MSFVLNLNIVLILWGGVLSLFHELNNITPNNIEMKIHLFDNPELNNRIQTGYTAIANYNDGFIATGTDGRIDWISITGKITRSEKISGFRFNCLLTNDQFIIAAGDHGNVAISAKNQPFQKIESGTDKNINSITLFDEFVIAGTDDGELLLGDPDGFFQIIRLNVKGNITSFSSNKTDCYGVTDEGEIMHSKDGLNWNISDFNQEYNGFYKACSFKKVLLTDNRIAVIGIHTDGSPAVLFSSQGNVWTERSLNYTDDQGRDGYLEIAPNDIIYDDFTDQFYLSCNNGKLMTLPSCTHCNELWAISSEGLDLTGISISEDKMIIVGENYFIQSFTLS